MSFFGASSQTVVPTGPAAEKDIEVADPPSDSISCLGFSSAADYLAVGSWDNNVRAVAMNLSILMSYLSQVRLYEVGPNGQTQGKAMYSHQGPVLSLCWNKAWYLYLYGLSFSDHGIQDGNKVISGGADNAARLFDVATGQSQQVAQHDQPIKVVKWVDTPQGGILATGSWDKTIKVRFATVNQTCNDCFSRLQYWDMRASAPVATVQLPERCYSMDVQYPLMVVGTAERHVQIFNLTNPNTAFKVRVCVQTPFRILTSPVLDIGITTEMANSHGRVFHVCANERVRDWEYRGTGSDSVSIISKRSYISFKVIRYIDDKDSAYVGTV